MRNKIKTGELSAQNLFVHILREFFHKRSSHENLIRLFVSLSLPLVCGDFRKSKRESTHSRFKVRILRGIEKIMCLRSISFSEHFFELLVRHLLTLERETNSKELAIIQLINPLTRFNSTTSVYTSRTILSNNGSISNLSRVSLPNL